MKELNSNFQSGFVAIVGQPNVGKSTLLNVLLKEKISIITPKPQTTRHRIFGILSGENYQAVFIDTPGLLTPHYALQEAMRRIVFEAIREADVVILLMEPVPFSEWEKEIIREIKKERKKSLLVFNKIDLVKKNALLPLIDEGSKLHHFAEIIPISALKNDGIEILLEAIVKLLPFSPPFYPSDQLTTQPERFFVSEIIREEIFKKFRQEIPYSTAVVIDEFKEKEKKDFIRAVIYLEKDSQKGILIGRGGGALKEIGQRAREQIENFLERKVYLELWVKIKKDWRKKKHWLKEFGYE